MDAVLRQLGRTEGSVKDRIEKLKQDLSYPDTADGRTHIMADVEAILRDAEKRAAALFDAGRTLPSRRSRFPVSGSQRRRELHRPGSRRLPSGHLPHPAATFSDDEVRAAKSRLSRNRPRASLPGCARRRERCAAGFRRIRAFGGIPALSEGWGLYAEKLAAESGWYDGDPEGRLGQLDSELFRARRLVVDTGLHAKHWTRQQAIDYGIEASEVERYVVYPGQACAYMIGELKILELRDRAKNALGKRFSAKDFHTAVLRTGTVPLEVLDRQIDAYIQQAIGSLGNWGIGE